MCVLRRIRLGETSRAYDMCNEVLIVAQIMPMAVSAFAGAWVGSKMSHSSVLICVCIIKIMLLIRRVGCRDNCTEFGSNCNCNCLFVSPFFRGVAISVEHGIWPQPQLTFKGVSRYLPCTLIICLMCRNIINWLWRGFNVLRAFFILGNWKSFHCGILKTVFGQSAIGNCQLAVGNWRLSTTTTTVTATVTATLTLTST